MLPLLPPHLNYVASRQLAREKVGGPPVGKPARHRQRVWQRVCAGCGVRLVGWGYRLLALAQPEPPGGGEDWRARLS